MYSIITSRARNMLHSSPPSAVTLNPHPKRRLSCFLFILAQAILTLTFATESIHAQTSQAFVSNFNGDNYRFPASIGDGTTYQRFTTGDYISGYYLQSIELQFPEAISASFSDWRDEIAVEIWSVKPNGRPDASIISLSIPPGDSLSGNVAFSAPEKAHLLPKTQYFMVVRRVTGSRTIRGKFNLTGNDAEDDGSQAGWKIANGYNFYSSRNGSWGTETLSMKMRINGTNAPLTTYSLTPTLSAKEGEDESLTITLTKTLEAPNQFLDFDITYDYSGGAEEDDFKDQSPIDFTVIHLASEATFGMPFAADNLVEGNETLTVKVVPTNSDWFVTPGKTDTATVTILDKDAPTAKIAFGADPTSEEEFEITALDNDSGRKVEVSINKLPSEETRFEIEVTGGTATEGNDYSITKSVTFGPETDKLQFLTLDTPEDGLVEFEETIELRIVPANEEVNDLGDYYQRHSEGSKAILPIQDYESDIAKIAFGGDAASVKKHTASVDENGQGSLEVPVTVSHLPSTSTDFAIEVLGTSSATESSDFLLGSTVTFGPDDTNKTKNVIVVIANDTDLEPDETIELRIVPADIEVDDLGDYYKRNKDGATAKITIKNDDPPPPRQTFRFHQATEN